MTDDRPLPPRDGGVPEPLALGDFRLLERVGGGTQGAVYRARQLAPGRTVALKLLAGNSAFRPASAARFAREAAVLARLGHPGVARCLGVGGERGFGYFALEFVDGPSVKALLGRTGGPLSPATAVYLARRCAEALAHASGRGVAHRDVKPGNILVAPGIVKLTDWGLAKPADTGEDLTAEHSVLGTLRYAPPEQFRDARKADRRSDIYALGGTLYEMLTGRVPFPGEDWPAVLAAKEVGAFAPAGALNPAVPLALDRILARMLAPDPAARYPDYGPLLGDLGAAGLPDEPSGLPTLAPEVGSTGSVPADVGIPRLRVLLVYDDPKYVPLAQHALFSAGVPHELGAVEDGRDAPAAARDWRAGWGRGPDVVVLGLTSPTHMSVRVLEAARGGPGRTPVVLWVSRSPDGATLLRGLGLGVGVWATGFADLDPLGDALRETHAALAGGPPGAR